eukprot:2378152-Prymnesium_polylepis.1
MRARWRRARKGGRGRESESGGDGARSDGAAPAAQRCGPLGALASFGGLEQSLLGLERARLE